ncbi:MAG: hypothetical protein IJS50_05165 [Desulfovibrio sp.]|nr:hypothetical protein [Desulfovibrio sp.]
MDRLLASLRPLLLTAKQNGPAILFLSATDMKERAITRHAVAANLEEALQKASASLSEALKKAEIAPTALRVDWVTEQKTISWNDFKKNVEHTRRNYFRKGIALESSFTIAFTEMELNANAMLYQAGDIRTGKIHEKNCKIYCQRRFGCPWPNLAAEQTVVEFTTKAAFVSLGEAPVLCTGQGLSCGRRDVTEHSPELFRKLAKTATFYLAKLCLASGRFNYGTFSCFDRPIPTYNTLRHISSTWSLVEAYAEFKGISLKKTIDRSIKYCLDTFLRYNGKAAYFEDQEKGELKLGSNGCALIMLTRYTEITKNKSYLPLMEALAQGILSMQEEDGSFVHILDSKTFAVKERQRTVYYDGEAVFGLLRLYSLTKNKTLLEAAQRAFAHFITVAHWKNHDHWLSYATCELTSLIPKEEYFRFGIQNFADYLSFVAERDTAYPTLLELMLAAEKMLKRLKTEQASRYLLNLVDPSYFNYALQKRATQLLNAFFWPELAMFFKKPEKIVGSFFIKHHAFRVRIDDIQHFLTGCLGYAKLLEKNLKNPQEASSSSSYRTNFPKEALATTPGKCWEAEPLAIATGGCWKIPPAKDWFVNALISNLGYYPLVQGPVLFVASTSKHCAYHLRIKEKTPWDTHDTLKKNWQKFAGAIVEHSMPELPCSFPQLIVPDGLKALIELGLAARPRFSGHVLGVTGSVGKTTGCEMLRHALAKSGSVMATYGSHNNKIGVPSVFASIPKETQYAILEMSIPSFAMRGGTASTYLKPEVALLTCVSEAHLDQWKSLETIAKLKSRLFSGMQQGGSAIINTDTPFFQLFVEVAQKQHLQILTYGTSKQAHIRLKDCAESHLKVEIKEKTYTLAPKAKGKHMALNICGVIGCLLALNLDFEAHFKALEEFTPLEGRGRTLSVNYRGKNLTIIDEAYNASPEYMRASLEAQTINNKASCVLILGDMLALGAKSLDCHLALAEHILKLKPARVLLLGEAMADLWPVIAKSCQGRWFKDYATLLKEIDHWLQDGDRLLIKGSHGTNLWKLVKVLCENNADENYIR